jgi:site-specific recombinase XerC
VAVPDAWHPPRGIWYEYNRQRPSKPYVLRWTDPQSVHPKSQSFATEEDREIAARALADKREDHGTEILKFDPREWRRWLEFKQQAPADMQPMEILREWQNACGKSRAGITVSEAVKEYLQHRAEGKFSKDTQRHVNQHVRDRFAATHSEVKVRDITAEMITAWLASLRSSRGPLAGKPVDPTTRKHHRKDVNAFFDFCISHGWITRNPCALVAVPHIEEEDVVLMTVDEGRRLFAANEGLPVAGRLALEAFGFLRASSAGRIQYEHINTLERGIRMPAPEHKSRKAKFRQGHPDNLWAWLNRAPDETWTMTESQYRWEKRTAFARAGLSGSDNRLRKTCLSAHLAWLRNQPLTSYLAQHRHGSTTDIYLGVMTERDGAAWFQIGPRFC